MLRTGVGTVRRKIRSRNRNRVEMARFRNTVGNTYLNRYAGSLAVCRYVGSLAVCWPLSCQDILVWGNHLPFHSDSRSPGEEHFLT